MKITLFGLQARFFLSALLLAGFVLTVGTLSASAATLDNAPAASKMACKSIQSQLKRDGRILLFTRRGKVEKFVRDVQYCNVNRSIRYTFVHAKDRRYCTVSICSSEDLLDDHSRGYHGGHHGGHHGRGRY